MQNQTLDICHSDWDLSKDTGGASPTIHVNVVVQSGSNLFMTVGRNNKQYVPSTSIEVLNEEEEGSRSPVPQASPPGRRRSQSLSHLFDQHVDEPLRLLVRDTEEDGEEPIYGRHRISVNALDLYVPKLDDLRNQQRSRTDLSPPDTANSADDWEPDFSVGSPTIMPGNSEQWPTRNLQEQESVERNVSTSSMGDPHSSFSSLSDASEASGESLPYQPPRQNRKPPVPKKPPRKFLKPEMPPGSEDGEGTYMCMGGIRDQNLSASSVPCGASGSIPRHLLDEVQTTLGFRQDVKGEFKRVRKILKPYKSKDGHYILWRFSDSVISLSVTFLQDIKNFAVCYDPDSKTWLILKNGPRASSLSTLLQLYMKQRIRLPLGNEPKPAPTQRGVPAVGSDRPPAIYAARPSGRPVGMFCPPGSNALSDPLPVRNDTPPPPLPPKRATMHVPSLPPRPTGFLTLVRPVIQPVEEVDVDPVPTAIPVIQIVDVDDGRAVTHL